MSDRPNILWLFCEDMSPWLSLYGDDTVPTPNLEALARAGTLFRHCYSPAGVCSPVRSGVITGCMPTTIGAHHHQSARNPRFPQHLPDGVRTLPELFREAGYFTYNCGKDDYNFTYDRAKLYSGPYQNAGIYGLHGAGSWRDRAPGQPFFGQITLWAGKNKNLPRAPVDPARVRVDPYYPDIPEFRSQYVRHYNQIMVTDDEVGALLQQLKDDGLYDNTIIFFFSDHGYLLLRHKQFLYDGGIHVPLIIHAPGRPDLLPPAGTRDDLVSTIDVAATSLACAGLEIPSWMESRNVFEPGYHRPYIVAARDRCDFTIERIRAVRTREFKYIRNFMTDRPLMQPQYRDPTPEYKALIRLHQEGALTPVQDQFAAPERPAEELYDLVRDPHETVNLARSPTHASVLKELRGHLDGWIRETNDQGQYPEADGQLLVMLEHWGRRCTDPIFDHIRAAHPCTEPRRAPPGGEVRADQRT